MQPLKPDNLDPIVREASLRPGKHWVPDELEVVYFAAYVSDNEEVRFGQVTKTSDGEWDAMNLQRVNAAQTGALCIGHFQGIKQAKAAVERDWEVIG